MESVMTASPDSPSGEVIDLMNQRERVA